MSQALAKFIESVTSTLTALAFQVSTTRQENERLVAAAEEAKKDWVPPPGPRGAFVIPQCIREAWDKRRAAEKTLEEKAETAAKAIFAADSDFSTGSLQELADTTDLSPASVRDARAAGDAVLRMAGAALRGHGMHADKYSAMGKLIAVAGLVPAVVDKDSLPESLFDRRSGRLVPDLAPRLTADLTGRHSSPITSRMSSPLG